MSTKINSLLSAEVNIFPNPVFDFLTVQGINASDKFTCKIYGIDGKEAISKNELIDNQIDVSLLPPSMYFLFLRNNTTHQSQRANFIKK